MKITVTGLNQILNQKGYQGNLDLTEPMTKSLALLQMDLATYPPQRPTSYKRTGTLGRAWTSEIEDVRLLQLTGKVGNNVKYAPFVQDDKRQAKIHKNHWQTVQDVAENREGEVRRIFLDYILNQL